MYMDKENNDIELKIIAVIDKIKPYLISDGGNLEYIKYENNIVYVTLTGACADCNMLDVTLNDGIEQLLINEIPEVKKVVNIRES